MSDEQDCAPKRHLSMGHRYSLVMATEVKQLLQGEMPPEMRLDFLSHLDKMIDHVITAEIIGMLDPMDEQGAELMKEARKLGYGLRSPNAFNVLDQKFEVFAALNPSLRTAYDKAAGNGR